MIGNIDITQHQQLPDDLLKPAKNKYSPERADRLI